MASASGAPGRWSRPAHCQSRPATSDPPVRHPCSRQGGPEEQGASMWRLLGPPACMLKGRGWVQQAGARCPPGCCPPGCATPCMARLPRLGGLCSRGACPGLSRAWAAHAVEAGLQGPAAGRHDHLELMTYVESRLPRHCTQGSACRRGRWPCTPQRNPPSSRELSAHGQGAHPSVQYSRASPMLTAGGQTSVEALQCRLRTP